MTLDDVCRIVLFQAIEEDATLWQILWELNYEFPDAEPKDRRATAARVTSALAHAGMITIARSAWNGDDQRSVPDGEIDDVVRCGSFWEPAAPGDVGLAINATDVGHAHYFGAERGCWLFG